MNALDVLTTQISRLNADVKLEYQLKAMTGFGGSTPSANAMIAIYNRFIDINRDGRAEPFIWETRAMRQSYKRLMLAANELEETLSPFLSAQDSLTKLIPSSSTFLTLKGLLNAVATSSDYSVKPSVVLIQTALKKFSDVGVPDEIYSSTSDDKTEAKLDIIFGHAVQYIDAMPPNRYILPSPKSFSSPYNETLQDTVEVIDFVQSGFNTFVTTATGGAATLNTTIGSFAVTPKGLEAFAEANVGKLFSVASSGDVVALNITHATFTTPTTSNTYIGHLRLFCPDVHGAEPFSNVDLNVSYYGLTDTVAGVQSLPLDTSGTITLSTITSSSESLPIGGVIRSDTLAVNNGFAHTVLEDRYLAGSDFYIHFWIASSALTSSLGSHQFKITVNRSESFPNTVSVDHVLQGVDNYGNVADVAGKTIDTMFSDMTLIPDSMRAGLIHVLQKEFDAVLYTDFATAVRIMFRLSSADKTYESFRKEMSVTWLDNEIESWICGGIGQWLRFRPDLSVKYSVFYKWVLNMLQRSRAVVSSVATEEDAAINYLYDRYV